MDIFTRRRTHFVLWRPKNTNPAPVLVIGQLAAGNPPTLANPVTHALSPNPTFPDLWEIPASACGLVDGMIYHYWFEVTDGSPDPSRNARILVTDPFAVVVDWRVRAPQLPSPYTDDDRDPLAVVKFHQGKLVVADPGAEVPDWVGDPAPATLPPNNRTVIYELPTRWSVVGLNGQEEIGVGTFRDAMALIDANVAGANFAGVPALAVGQKYLVDLGINAIELLPPADSFQDREWGYATSNYFAPDYDLGFAKGHASPTAASDLTKLVKMMHANGIRFLSDVVMAFATRYSYENVNYPDFHVIRGTGDPNELNAEGKSREDFGGKLFRYNALAAGYDPLTGAQNAQMQPARQLMKSFLTHWMRTYRVDGFRIDSTPNINNWDFLEECTDATRAAFHERWPVGHTPADADARFFVIAEELPPKMAMLTQGRVDALWNECFKQRVREIILGKQHYDDASFEQSVRSAIDCRAFGFSDGAQAINYVTSHDVQGFKSERLKDYLKNNGIFDAAGHMKLAFVCLLTSVGVPMILAGEEFADEHDKPTSNPQKQTDPVNFERLSDPWRRSLFQYVARLVKLRTSSEALSVNDTNFIHVDISAGKRVLAWSRGNASTRDLVVVVANFSEFGTPDPSSPSAEYRVNNWPSATGGRTWREITQERSVPLQWAGREPGYPWEAKVYQLA